MMSLWSLGSAPLILGTNLTDLTSVDQAMLENRAVIAVDQDGIAARRVIDSASEQVFAKRQPNGIWYIGVFNTDTSARRTFRVSLAQLGLSHEVRVTDLWTGRSLGIVSGSDTATIAPGGVSLISARPIPGTGEIVNAGAPREPCWPGPPARRAVPGAAGEAGPRGTGVDLHRNRIVR